MESWKIGWKRIETNRSELNSIERNRTTNKYLEPNIEIFMNYKAQLLKWKNEIETNKSELNTIEWNILINT